MSNTSNATVWCVWSPGGRVVSEHATHAEAQYWADAYGAGYWVSSY